MVRWCLLLVLALPVWPANAQVKNFTHGEWSPLAASDLRPRMSDGEGYVEKWQLQTKGEDFDMFFMFQVANLGWGDYKGKVSGHIVKKGEKDDWFLFYETFGEGKWKHAKEGFELTMGAWKIGGDPERGQYTVSGVAGSGDDTVRFTYTLRGTGHKPGTGKTRFPDGSYFNSEILLTAGSAEGTLEHASGERWTASGVAYGNHYATNLGAHELMDRVHSFRVHEGKTYIEWWRYDTPERFGGEPFGYVVVAYDGEVVFESVAAEVGGDDFHVEPKYGYAVPRAIDVYAPDDVIGEHRAVLTLRATEVETSDPLDGLPGLERAVAEQFAKPMDFDMTVTWTLDLSAYGLEASVGGEADMTVTVMR